MSLLGLLSPGACSVQCALFFGAVACNLCQLPSSPCWPLLLRGMLANLAWPAWRGAFDLRGLLFALHLGLRSRPPSGEGGFVVYAERSEVVVVRPPQGGLLRRSASASVANANTADKKPGRPQPPF